MITVNNNAYSISRGWNHIQSRTTEKGHKWYEGDYTTKLGIVTVYCDDTNCRLDFVKDGKVHVRNFHTDTSPDPSISAMFSKRQIACRCNQFIHDVCAGKLVKAVKPYDPFNL